MTLDVIFVNIIFQVGDQFNLYVEAHDGVYFCTFLNIFKCPSEITKIFAGIFFKQNTVATLQTNIIEIYFQATTIPKMKCTGESKNPVLAIVKR